VIIATIAKETVFR